MDAWGHHIARDRAAGIEAVMRQSFADDVSVGHHADQPVVLSNRNGAYVMLTHQFRELGDRRLWTDPVDALVHCVLDFHGGPPLLKFAYQPRFPRLSDYTTDRILSHGLKAHRAPMLASRSFRDRNHGTKGECSKTRVLRPPQDSRYISRENRRHFPSKHYRSDPRFFL